MYAEVFDCETTFAPHNIPWDTKAYLCSIGAEGCDPAKDSDFKRDTSSAWFFNVVDTPTKFHNVMLAEIQQRINKADLLVFHNAKFDLAWFIEAQLSFEDKPIWCTMIGDYILYGQNPDIKLNLNACAQRRGLGIKNDQMKEFWEAGIQTDEIPLEIHEEYLKRDVHLTKQLFLQQYKDIKAAKLQKIAHLSFEVCKILTHMEYTGIPFDKEGGLKYVKEYKNKIDAYDTTLQQLARIKFSPSSSVQLAAVMYGGVLKKEVKELVAKQRKNGTFRVLTRKATMNVPVRGLGFTPHESTLSTKTARYSTGKKARELLHIDTDIQQKFYEVLQDRANCQKVYSTLWSDTSEDAGLLRKIGKDRRLHPNFNQTVTHTGRLSSSNPNGQNLPRSGTSPLKKLITSSLGYLINVDLSQIEWRTAAALSKDPVMCEEIRTGFDAHTFAANEWFDGKNLDPTSKEFKAKRQAAKTFNFRMIYNGKPKAFFFDGAMPRYPLDKWQELVKNFWDKYRKLRKWQLTNEKVVSTKKYLRNVSGRVLSFTYNLDPSVGVIGYNLNAICNYPVQSISADLMFLAMVQIYKKVRELKLKSKLLLQVHDSLLWDCPRNEVYQICNLCINVFEDLPRLSKEYFNWEINVPLTGEVSFGKDYGSLTYEFKADEITPKSILSALRTLDKENNRINL